MAQGRQQTSRQVLVSIADRKLAVLEDGRVLKVFPVAVGATDSPSPAGEFQIINRLTNPTYYHTGTVIPAGPANPLGTRWMGLNLKGYGIHGTNAPRSIGKAASHGCIRLSKRDLEQLFEMVRVGDTVAIRAEADAQTAQIFGSTETLVAQANTTTTAADRQ
jgi:L,D-transpeptidase ErfK/SrfK